LWHVILQVQLEMEKAIADDPTVYEYDSIYDNLQATKASNDNRIESKGDRKVSFCSWTLQFTCHEIEATMAVLNPTKLYIYYEIVHEAHKKENKVINLTITQDCNKCKLSNLCRYSQLSAWSSSRLKSILFERTRWLLHKFNNSWRKSAACIWCSSTFLSAYWSTTRLTFTTPPHMFEMFTLNLLEQNIALRPRTELQRP